MPTTIGREEVRDLLGSGDGVVAEVLPPAEYDWAHIRGAVHLPFKRWDPGAVRQRFDPHQPIVVYCHDLY